MASRIGMWWQKSRFYSWWQKIRSGLSWLWQKIRHHPFIAMGIIVLLIALIILIIAVVLSNGTGFNGYTVKSTATETTLSPQTKVTTTVQSQPGKTLWDVLQLLAALAIPVVVGFGAAWFTAQQGKVSERENKDNQREKALQDYIDKMSELLLEKKLRDSAEEDEIRKIARVRTLTVLRGLDPTRKASVIQFLHESGLIDIDKCIISLSGADLTEVYLFSAKLSGANLSEANLWRANLLYADLSGANLSKAILLGADLSKATLLGANLSGATIGFADLSGANLSEANLSEASLNSANLSKADLSGANLSEADLYETFLSGANLSGADLSRANLRGADLSRANLRGADLSRANLRGAEVTDEQLKTAKSLKDATMPDGSIHP